MIVINLYGGPGSGKSTMAAYIFSELKERGYNAELVTEYAKDLTWEKSMTVLDNQIYVFAKQFHRIWRLKDQVDFIVTDSPLLLSLIYKPPSEKFKDLVVEQFLNFDNFNVFLQRVKKFNPKGREHTEEQSKILDIRIKEMLEHYNIPLDLDVPGYSTNRPLIIETILQKNF